MTHVTTLCGWFWCDETLHRHSINTTHFGHHPQAHETLTREKRDAKLRWKEQRETRQNANQVWCKQTRMVCRGRDKCWQSHSGTKTKLPRTTQKIRRERAGDAIHSHAWCIFTVSLAREARKLHALTSSFDSSLSLICVQKTGRRMPRHNGKRKIFESTRSLMHFIFHWVRRPAGIFVMISTMKLLLVRWEKIWISWEKISSSVGEDFLTDSWGFELWKCFEISWKDKYSGISKFWELFK